MAVVKGSVQTLDRHRKVRFHLSRTSTYALLEEFPLYGSNIEVVEINQDQSSSVSAAGAQNVDITAPAGQVATILGVRLDVVAPTGAASGTHEFRVQSGNSVEYIIARSVYSSAVSYRSSHIYVADSLKLPSDQAAQERALIGRMFSASQSLRINYQNNTDVAQTNNRIIRFLVKYEGVTT